MFSLPNRIVIVVIAAAVGSYRLANSEQSGYVWLVGATIVIIGYFRYGSIRPAFLALRRGDLDVARKHIQTTKFPRLLSAQSRTYLHWIQGVLAAQDTNSLSYAEEQMRLAIDGSLRTSNDRCLATATLAQIVAQNNDLERARQILEDAKQIPHRNRASEYLAKLNTDFDDAK